MFYCKGSLCTICISPRNTNPRVSEFYQFSNYLVSYAYAAGSKQKYQRLPLNEMDKDPRVGLQASISR